MLRIHLFSIVTIKTPLVLNREDTNKCTLYYYVPGQLSLAIKRQQFNPLIE